MVTLALGLRPVPEVLYGAIVRMKKIFIELCVKRQVFSFVIGAIALIVICYLFYTLTIHKNERQITDIGGIVFLDIHCNSEGCPVPPNLETGKWTTKYKNWLLRPFHKIVHVRLAHTELSDNDLAILDEFKNLISLDLTATEITDNGIEYIGQIKTLRTIRLENTEVSQVGIDRLRILNPSLNIEGWASAESSLFDVIREEYQ